MSLESLHYIQTPTKLTLEGKPHLPISSAVSLLAFALLVGSPLLGLGIALLIGFPLQIEVVGSILVTVGLFPLASIAYSLVNSLSSIERCTFDKGYGKVTLTQRHGLFDTQVIHRPLSQVVDIEVQEEVYPNGEIETYSIYRLVIVLRQSDAHTKLQYEHLPLTSSGCYYKEIPQETATSIRKFLNLSVVAGKF